jgi:catechol 2,3-dioxygenase-like lactoylglutathione lyase family enzyme
MISVLDHVSLRTLDTATAIADYTAVLGRTAHGSRIQLGNMALEVVTGDQPAGVAEVGLVFAAADLPETARRLARRAVPNETSTGGRVILDKAATHQVAIELVAQPSGAGPLAAGGTAAGTDIAGLDHVVVRTRDPERAVALYAGRLGLDLRLDRTNPERNNRLLFFVCGDLVVEVSHDTAKGVRPGPDAIWGLAWRAADIDAAHARMTARGIAVSQVRTGNRPGTEVFTVKSHTAGVPTLVIGGHGLSRR